MELRRDPRWSTRAGMRKFVNNILKPHYERLKRVAKDAKELLEGRRILGLCRKNFLKILAKSTCWKPAETKFNIPFLKEALKGIEGAEEVLDWLENGIPMAVDHETVEENVKQEFKRHSCFDNPLAILKWTEHTIREMEKGHILGPFDARSAT